MANNEPLRLFDYELAHCPRCGAGHRFQLVVRVTAQQTAPLFGGEGRSEFALACPTTGGMFTERLADPPGATILGPADPGQQASLERFEPGKEKQAATAASAPANPEFADWLKSSRSTAIDFCKLMLTTSTSAIPLFFSVMKYLGSEKIGTTTATRLSILPPLLFLSAAALFVLGMKPILADIAEADFAAFRARRLRLLNRYLTAGTGVFALGVALAIFLFFSVLMAGQF